MKTLIIVIGIVLLSLPAQGQDNNDWHIKFSSGKTLYEVELAQIQGDSIGISNQGTLEWYGINDITTMELSGEHSTALRDGLIGAALLGGLGFAIASAEDSHKEEYQEQSNTKFLWGGAGALTGGIGGVVLGNTSSTEVEYNMERLDATQKRAIVEKIFQENISSISTTIQQSDAVRLRKGGTIKGTVTENMEDSTVTIHTIEGGIVTYPRSEVFTIERREPISQAMQMENKGSAPIGSGLGLEIQAGVTVPLGDFSGTNGGKALTGFMFKANMTYPVFMNENQSFIVQSLTSASVSINGVDIEYPAQARTDFGFWITGWPLTGIRLMTRPGGDFAFHCSGQAGILAGSSPPITIDATTYSLEQPNSSAIAFAYQAGAGIVFQDRFLFEVYYMSGSPKYTLTKTENSVLQTDIIKQETSLLSLTLGLVF